MSDYKDERKMVQRDFCNDVSVPRVEVPQFKKKCERSGKRNKTGSDSLQGQRHLKKSDNICLTCALGELIVTNYWENVDIIIT